MRRGVVVLAGLVILMLAGGVLTSNLGFGVPLIIQSTDPNASVFDATPEQALQFTIWVGFVIAVLVGTGSIMALAFWFANRIIKIAAQIPTRSELEAANEGEAA